MLNCNETQGIYGICLVVEHRGMYDVQVER